MLLLRCTRDILPQEWSESSSISDMGVERWEDSPNVFDHREDEADMVPRPRRKPDPDPVIDLDVVMAELLPFPSTADWELLPLPMPSLL